MHLQTISDVDAFFPERRACTEQGRSNGRPVVGVLKQTTARSASGWEHAYDYGGPASHGYGSMSLCLPENSRRFFGAAAIRLTATLHLPRLLQTAAAKAAFNLTGTAVPRGTVINRRMKWRRNGRPFPARTCSLGN